MEMKDSKLFSPLKVGKTVLQNRIGLAPMSMDYEAADGTVPKRLADIFVRRAEGGCGFVVIDAVTVDHKYWYIGRTTALDRDELGPSAATAALLLWAPPLTRTQTATFPAPSAWKRFRPL